MDTSRLLVILRAVIILLSTGVACQDDYEAIVTKISITGDKTEHCLPLLVAVYSRIQCTKELDLVADSAKAGCEKMTLVSECNKALGDKIKTCFSPHANYFKTLVLLYERTINFVCGQSALIMNAIFGPATEVEPKCPERGEQQCLVKKGNVCHLMLSSEVQEFFCACTDKFDITVDRMTCYLKAGVEEPPDVDSLTYPPDAYPVDDFQAPKANGSIVCGHTFLESFRATFEKAFFHDLPKPVQNGDYLCTHIPREMLKIMDHRQCNDEAFGMVIDVVRNDASCFVHWAGQLEGEEKYKPKRPLPCGVARRPTTPITVDFLCLMLVMFWI